MTEESRLLEDLLADAHARIRELQSNRDRLAEELLTLQVNDRPSSGRISQQHRARASICSPVGHLTLKESRNEPMACQLLPLSHLWSCLSARCMRISEAADLAAGNGWVGASTSAGGGA